MLKYTRGRGLAWRRIGDEAVIVDLRSNRAVGISAPGAAVWHALDQQRSLAELVDAAGLPPERSADVQRFLTSLVELGLVATEGEDRVIAAFSGPEVEQATARTTVLWCEQLEKFAGFCAKEPGNSPCGTQVSLS